MKTISRVLVANRGEIAVRIIKACQDLGIGSIAVVSDADRESLPAKMADRVVCIGPPRSLDSYLKIETLITAALATGADAIHPGYGFLAEQPELVEACNEHGIIFIGPSAENIRKMGNKLVARSIAKDCGIPTIPGSKKVSDIREGIAEAEKISYPVFIKAAAGGGGRGMKIAYNHEDFRSLFDSLSAEANAAFGDGTLYIEHYIPNARHIEVQILGDKFGNTVHLGERDCSVQRRYQKMIEEAPSPVVTEKMRKEICNAAITIANTIGYVSAGTVEFVFNQDKNLFYFLEMNTRIQVEHPVTEEVTGIDLVQEQINLANGTPLALSQEDIKFNYHSIECRINAESPIDFMPCPGLVTKWEPPKDVIRLDTCCYEGYTIPPYYDSMIAKLIAKDNNRDKTIGRMIKALENFTVSGIETNIPFHLLLLNHPDFKDSKINTQWLESKIIPEIRSK